MEFSISSFNFMRFFFLMHFDVLLFVAYTLRMLRRIEPFFLRRDSLCDNISSSKDCIISYSSNYFNFLLVVVSMIYLFASLIQFIFDKIKNSCEFEVIWLLLINLRAVLFWLITSWNRIAFLLTTH